MRTSQTPASASPVSSNPRPRSEILNRLDKFWHRVTEGLELSELWKQFSCDARASYRLYQTDFNRRVPEGTRRQDFFHTAQEFIWALLEKLTPARRVLLLIGVLMLIFPASSFTYQSRAGHLEVTEFDFHFLGGIILLLLLLLEVADRVVMKRDLEIARDIQRWLLPAEVPQVPTLDIAFATRPANTVAGDYYDVFARPGENARYLLAVADVAGKSIPAALLMATLQASLRTLSATPCTLPELAVGMNRYACTNSQSGLRFTTAFLAEYNPADHVLTYINAGHNQPIMIRKSGTIERLGEGGLPLGIQADGTYEMGSVSLEPSDWLVVFTDGLVEAVDAGGEEYGEQRLLEVMKADLNTGASSMLKRIMNFLDTFTATTLQHDDVTCLLVRAV